jgi:hypothetical protein
VGVVGITYKADYIKVLLEKRLLFSVRWNEIEPSEQQEWRFGNLINI